MTPEKRLAEATKARDILRAQILSLDKLAVDIGKWVNDGIRLRQSIDERSAAVQTSLEANTELLQRLAEDVLGGSHDDDGDAWKTGGDNST